MTRKEVIADIIRVYKSPPNPEYQMAHLEDILQKYVESEVKKLNKSDVSGQLFAFMKFHQENNSAVWSGMEHEIKRYLKANNLR